MISQNQIKDKLNEIDGLKYPTLALKIIAFLTQGGIVKCEDLVALEREVLDWSDVHRFSALMAKMKMSNFFQLGDNHLSS